MTDELHVLRYRPPRIAMALAAIGMIAHLASPFTIHAGLPVLAGIVAAAGCSIMLRAWWLFRTAGTAICPTARTSTLITRDVYRVSRHPMYLGMTLMLAAAGLATGDGVLYLPAVVFWMIVDHHFAPYEERELASAWGDAYLDYRARVRRWIGRTGP